MSNYKYYPLNKTSSSSSAATATGTSSNSSTLYKPTIGTITTSTTNRSPIGSAAAAATNTRNTTPTKAPFITSNNNAYQINSMSNRPRPIPIPSNNNNNNKDGSGGSHQYTTGSRYVPSSYTSNILPDIGRKTATKLTSQSPSLFNTTRTRSPSVGAAQFHGATRIQSPQTTSNGSSRNIITQFNDLNIATTTTATSTYSSAYNMNNKQHQQIYDSSSQPPPPSYSSLSDANKYARKINGYNNNANDNDDDGADGDGYDQSDTGARETRSVGLENKGIVGLKNIGNTCFMNSILQCLNNSKLLIQYCIKKQYANDLNTTMSRMKGSLFTTYAKLVQLMWSTGDGSVTPQEFKSKIAFYAPRFVGYSQQDAQEFLRYLLLGLHDDVNLIRTKPKPIVYDEKSEERMSDAEKSEHYWQNYLSFDRSKIVDMFVGQLKSVLTCTHCDYKSVTFDPFWDLSLPIPSSLLTVTLYDCLKLFMAEEILDGDEKPTCARCKQRRKCTKRFSIQKLPENLVLHLKRFSPQHRRKLETNVQYPMQDLDLRKYLSSDTADRNSANYDLYGISYHSGSQSYGHYVASCKHPFTKKWYHYDDSSVTDISTNRLQSSQAYVLFYEKVK